jgi:hypothetical protein
MTRAQVNEILAKHQQWLKGEPGGIQADFSGQDLFCVDLRRTDLRGAKFRGAHLRRSNFSGAKLVEADFRDAYLFGAAFCNTNLTGADFTRADLANADFSGAILFNAVGLPAAPIIPDIHRRMYEAARQPIALRIGHWHTCDTTHCRAGWAITLAGEPGRLLAQRYGASVAAALIYVASDPMIAIVPDWYASDKAALNDMARLAGKY